jgi:predicted metalloprotease with PDZ domain
MQRSAVIALGVSSLLAGCFVLGAGRVRAGEKDSDEKKVAKKVEVVRLGGGAFLGVGLDEVEGELRGAKVRSVEADSPAAKAGLKEGDVIVRFDGEGVRSAAQLARLVRETPAGRSVPIEVNRAGAVQKLTATLAEGHRRFHIGGGDMGSPDLDLEVPEPPVPPLPPHAPMAPRAPMPPHAFNWKWNDEGGLLGMLPGGPRKLGIEYQEIGDQLAAYFKLAQKTGVLVTSVDADGPAGKAGIKAGDVILKFEGKAIEEGGDLRDAVRAEEGGKEVTVTVQRDGRPLDLKVTLAKPAPVRHRRAGETT